MGKGKGKRTGIDETTPLLGKPSERPGIPRSAPIPIGGRMEHRSDEPPRQSVAPPQPREEVSQKKPKKPKSPGSMYLGNSGFGFPTGHTFYLDESSEGEETDDESQLKGREYPATGSVDSTKRWSLLAAVPSWLTGASRQSNVPPSPGTFQPRTQGYGTMANPSATPSVPESTSPSFDAVIPAREER
jgi:hypothetical protein